MAWRAVYPNATTRTNTAPHEHAIKRAAPVRLLAEGLRAASRDFGHLVVGLS
jgi:hypothetical protein